MNVEKSWGSGVLSHGENVYEIGSSFASELKLNQAQFPHCENESLGEGAIPCLQERRGCGSSRTPFPGLLRSPSPFSPGTDPLQGLCLNRGVWILILGTCSTFWVWVSFWTVGKPAAYVFIPIFMGGFHWMPFSVELLSFHSSFH